MAVNKAPAAKADGEVSEHEYQATLNRAVEDTEREIFADALGDAELDNDGDTSLEEMGDGLEGEVEDDAEEEAEGEGKEGEEEAKGEDGEEAEPAEGEEGEEEAEEPARDQDGRFQRQDDRRIPSGRLKAEADQRRAAEQRNADLERMVAEMNGRIAELSARANAPAQRQQQTEAPPKPDKWADEDGYERWVLDQAERRAQGTIERRLTEFKQQQEAIAAQRVDENLAGAARGDRAFEFGPAYNALTSLDPRNPQSRATVASIYNAADPAKALFAWWDENGGPEYRERVYEQVAPRVQRNGNGARQPQREAQDQPRHVIRPGQRLPSLNSASGSNSQRVNNPEMLDGSERSIFEYGTRR